MDRHYIAGKNMRKFYLHKRNGIFYAEIISSTGVKLSARSTRVRDRDEAVMTVSNWLANGIPSGKKRNPISIEAAADLSSILKAIKKAHIDKDGAMLIVAALREQNLIDFSVTKTGQEREKLIPFLMRFWDMDISPYLRDKIAHGHRITVSYCRDAIKKIIWHWQPRFGDTKTINEITRSDIREFSYFLKEKGLKSNTVKNIMSIGKTAFKWAYREEIISSDPSTGLMNFTGDQITRDILSEKETEKLFKINWSNKKAYTAALLSLTTGLRSGEIRALRKNDIGDSTLNIMYSWNEREGLKCPKNGEKRLVPLLPQVRVRLLQLLKESPHKNNDNPFIFYSLAHAQRPCCSSIFLYYFRLTCKKLSINLKNRKLDFHSFRHLFSTRMAERIEGNKVAKITGHRSQAAARIYQSHVTARILSEMENEMALEFKDILEIKNNYEKKYERTKKNSNTNSC
jgi:integrase